MCSCTPFHTSGVVLSMFSGPRAPTSVRPVSHTRNHSPSEASTTTAHKVRAPSSGNLTPGISQCPGPRFDLRVVVGDEPQAAGHAPRGAPMQGSAPPERHRRQHWGAAPHRMRPPVPDVRGEQVEDTSISVNGAVADAPPGASTASTPSTRSHSCSWIASSAVSSPRTIVAHNPRECRARRP